MSRSKSYLHRGTNHSQEIPKPNQSVLGVIGAVEVLDHLQRRATRLVKDLEYEFGAGGVYSGENKAQGKPYHSLQLPERRFLASYNPNEGVEEAALKGTAGQQLLKDHAKTVEEREQESLPVDCCFAYLSLRPAQNSAGPPC
ncbi:hypothetical protein HGM15179_003782 [Zosterops borbonicus]|uniref:Uncharacterized protein n=1 Tax=Zosterops borbonicus TaxID=364589 RepID=A0A8K1GQE0_9PASS|nr:hypothetical protein HGM15179_003782 [Zosterops borbonicus]